MTYVRFILVFVVVLALGGTGYAFFSKDAPPSSVSEGTVRVLLQPIRAELAELRALITGTQTIETSSASMAAINRYYSVTGVTHEYLEARLAVFKPASRTMVFIERGLDDDSSSSVSVDDIAPSQLLATDFGGFTCNGTTCSLDTELYGMEDLADVGAMTETYGDVLMWNGTAWTNTATSSLGLSSGSSFSYPFPSNATSTMLTFSGGLLSVGSTTIHGNATTTGDFSAGAVLTVRSGGSVGIGTTTPGSLLSLQGVANFTTATSTFYGTGGINLATGCFAIGGNCVGGGAVGLSSYDAWTHPAAGQSATTSLMLFNGNASSTQLSAGVAYFGQTGTTTITAAGFVGVGSSTPWAQLSINPTNANGTAPSFAIGSSTATSFIITNSGNVGIGTTSPAAKLGVAGSIYTTGDLILGNGTGKLTVGTVDPVYTIGGVNYATYMSGMIGVKEEVTGTAVIDTLLTADDGSSGYVAVLDFDEETPGSDLWVFAQATHIRKHIDQLVVLLSAENGAEVWYQIDEAQRRVYLLSDAPTRVSYRMTAPRFDSAAWTNYNLDGITGFKPPADDLTEYFADAFTLSFGASIPASLSEGLMLTLRTWFADAANGIESLVANVLSAKEMICVDGACLTKDDIRALLELVRDEQLPPPPDDSVPPELPAEEAPSEDGLEGETDEEPPEGEETGESTPPEEGAPSEESPDTAIEGEG